MVQGGAEHKHGKEKCNQSNMKLCKGSKPKFMGSSISNLLTWLAPVFNHIFVDCFQIQTVVVPLPTSSSSDKYDANDDDVISIERQQQETTFVVVAQSKMKLGLPGHNADDEEMR